MKQNVIKSILSRIFKNLNVDNRSQVRSPESEKVIQSGVEGHSEKISKEVCSAKTDVETALFMSDEMMSGLNNTALNSKSSFSSERESCGDFQLKIPRSGPPDLHAPILTFSARLLTYVNELCDGKAPEVYRRAKVSRKIYSRIVSDNQARASKDTVMKFTIGLQLDMQQAELLMKSAGYSFSSSIPLDMAFVYCIENKIWSLDDLNEMLARSGYKGVAFD